MIINEFGEIGLDHLLVEHVEDDVMLLLDRLPVLHACAATSSTRWRQLLRGLDNGRIALPPRHHGDHRPRRSGAGAAHRDGCIPIW